MPIRCVIVDDNADFLGAASGLAYRVCRELQPDVMLIDVDLDNETGFEVASGLAQGSGQEQPHVILISAHHLDEFENLMADVPAAAVVSKTRLSGRMIRDIIGSAGLAIRGGSQRDSR